MLKKRFQKGTVFEEEDVNPLESVANLLDAMLVLAVGIMLAVILAWNLDINQISQAQEVSPDGMVEIEAENIGEGDEENAIDLDDYGLYEAGKLYKDAEGNMYVISE